MESRRDKITNFLSRAGMRPGLQVRSAGVRAPDPDNKDDIRMVLFTENPVEVFDWKTFEFWDEVLLADGVVYPGINQIPLLNCHNMHTVENLLGHVEDFQKISTGDVAGNDGQVLFAADQLSQDTRQKVLDRHLTDGSLGYITDGVVYIAAGAEAKVKGKVFQGPLKVAYDFRCPEYSMTPIGADILSKVKWMMENG